MAKNKNSQVETQTEIKKLAGQVSEQISAKDYDGAWQTMGKLNALYKEDEHGLEGLANSSLKQLIKNYYYNQKKMSSGAYALSKIATELGEVAALIKPEK